MTIEIKQLHVKSTVVQRAESSGLENADEEKAPSDESLKAEILMECRQMMMELFRSKRER